VDDHSCPLRCLLHNEDNLKMISRQILRAILFAILGLGLGLGVAQIIAPKIDIPAEETKIEIVYNNEAGARCFVLLQRDSNKWKPVALSCVIDD